eukprot:1201466-Amphidinium_carterae.1
MQGNTFLAHEHSSDGTPPKAQRSQRLVLVYLLRYVGFLGDSTPRDQSFKRSQTESQDSHHEPVWAMDANKSRLLIEVYLSLYKIYAYTVTQS